MDFRWRSVGDYLKAFDAEGTALNVVQLVGHGTLRIAVMGFARRAPDRKELARMQRLMTEAMEDGAWGLSTGLIYAPGSYASTEEIVEIARVAGRHRGFYASHIRGEGATLLDAEGKRLSEVGAERGMDPLDAAFELLVDEAGRGYVILFQLDEADLRRALAHPAVMIGSDGSALAPYGVLGTGKPHPRSYGTFPRVLGEYARAQRLLGLPEAVHKMTGLPAKRLRLRDRGVIRVGAKADLVVFDPRRVADQATYDAPHRYPVGIEHVVVNGSIVVKDGAHTGSLPGKLLTPV